MGKIIFVDLNRQLVEKVSLLGIPAICGDYFREIYKIQQPVLMTASNPQWTFGGGIDYAFLQNYPHCIHYKQIKGGTNERITNIVFTTTVDKTLRATKESIRTAIRFAIDHTYEGETLVLSGVGTGIGGLSLDDFVSVVQELLDDNEKYE